MKQSTLAAHQVVALAYDRLCTFEFGCVVEVFTLDRPELEVDWYHFSVCSTANRRNARPKRYDRGRSLAQGFAPAVGRPHHTAKLLSNPIIAHSTKHAK
jgi:hypothetical protein